MYSTPIYNNYSAFMVMTNADVTVTPGEGVYLLPWRGPQGETDLLPVSFTLWRTRGAGRTELVTRTSVGWTSCLTAAFVDLIMTLKSLNMIREHTDTHTSVYLIVETHDQDLQYGNHPFWRFQSTTKKKKTHWTLKKNLKHESHLKWSHPHIP